MASLATRKNRLRVEFSDAVRERGKSREVLMEFTPYCIRIHLKGLRSVYEVSPASIYNHAVRCAVEKQRTERKARKAGR